MACVHIAIKDLRPGMYIVQTGESWRNRPFLYAKPGLVANEAEIAAIQKQGFQEAYYDPERSQNVRADGGDLLTQTRRHPQAPSASLQEELGLWSERYDTCVSRVTDIMEEARGGHVDWHAASPLVLDIIKSLGRNADALVSLAKMKSIDAYTYTHCVNVAIFSVAFGQHLGLEGKQLHDLGMAGLLHDIGKMRIPVAVLNAKRKLTSAEYSLVQKHARYGADMLAEVPSVEAAVVEGVCDHHERFNGSGYPGKKKGPEITPFGRILAVCDVYDALSSTKSYNRAMPPSQSLSIMYGMRGEAWEEELIEHFIKMLGIYPVGTPIALTGGFKGIVVQSNNQAPLYPTILLCLDKKGQPITPPVTVDLAQQHDFQIIKAVSPDTIPCDILTLLTEQTLVSPRSCL